MGWFSKDYLKPSIECGFRGEHGLDEFIGDAFGTGWFKHKNISVGFC